MDWNNSSGEDRIEHWRDFRKNLATSSETIKIHEVVRYFASAPYVSRTLDYYDPVSWLTPWEILSYGVYCRSAISLMMYYTLALSGVSDKLDVSLLLIDDGNDVYLVTLVGNQLVLNYDLGKIIYLNELNGVNIKARYSSEQLKKIN